MTQSLSIANRSITPEVWKMILSIAPVMHQSRLFGAASADQAAAIMLKGYELGLGLGASFEFIQVVDGKPTLSPRGALALIYQSGQLAKMHISEVIDSCTVSMTRKNGFSYELTWTMGDAERTGQVKAKSTWEKYPANMLRWRAIGFCADVVFPDILGGLKRADEFGADIDKMGNVVSLDWSKAKTSNNVIEITDDMIPVSAIIESKIDQLIQQYGIDHIMQISREVNGIDIPRTEEEVEECALELALRYDGVANEDQ